MATITTGNFAKALWPGVNEWYGQSYNDFKVEYTDIFTTHKSKRAWEEDVLVSSFGLAYQLPEGSSVQYDTERQGFTTRYVPVEFALGFIITKNMVADDLYNIVGPRRSKALARSLRQTKETNGANILNRAFNSSYTYGDGKELLNSVRPNVAGGTWSNIIGTAADISEAALEQAVIDMGKWTDDRGLKIAVRPKKIVVPVDLDFEVNKIMKTEYEVGTANNTVNLVRSRFPGGVCINHYLTDTDAWFILTSEDQNGMKYIERAADSFDMDNDFDTSNAKFKAQGRYAFGMTDPRSIYGSAGA